MSFKKIGLCDELVQGILATGYTAPTEIQAEAIPVVIAGKDMIGCAQTGTGKTAAFVLPILNRIAPAAKTKKKKLRSLIVTPTRELAMQIDKSVQGYGRFTRVKSLAVFGGTPIEKQIKFIKTGVDIITATPGRLIDHLNRGTIDLSAVEVLVLDEADRMLDMGFINDINKIIAKTPKDRQTLLFSATMSGEIKKLSKTILRSPKMIQIGIQHDPVDTITQHIYPVAKEQKMELLLHMLDRHQMYSVLIFSRTKRGADRICRKLKKNNIDAVAIHSDRTQRQRLRALEGFKQGKFQVMVATDIAARGINVEGISHVFNYDVPAFPEDYVHRIGRTGRAEATGDAITFVSSDEIQNLRKIERFIDFSFNEKYYEDFEYTTKVKLSAQPKRKNSKKRKSQNKPRTGSGKNKPSNKTSRRRQSSSPAKKTASRKKTNKNKSNNKKTSSAKSKNRYKGKNR